MPKMIDNPTQCHFRIPARRYPETYGACRHPAACIDPSIECRNGRVFGKNCPLHDAPDPERYRVAVWLLRRVSDLIDINSEYSTEACVAIDITAFLAGEDGG